MRRKLIGISALSMFLTIGCGHFRRPVTASVALKILPDAPQSTRYANPGRSRRTQAAVEPFLPPGFPITTRFGDWTNIGPGNYGGKVWDIAVSPVNSDVVFVAYGDGGGLWKSANGGATWKIVNDSSRNPSLSSVNICNTNPSVVIAGLNSAVNGNTDVGLLKSTDGGTSWKPIGPTVDSQYNFADVKCSINDANIYYAANEQALWKTVDGGVTWKKLIEYYGNAWFDGLPSLALDRGDPNTLLLWGHSVDVQRSTDGGVTWSAVGKNMDQSHPATFAWSPSNPCRSENLGSGSLLCELRSCEN